MSHNYIKNAVEFFERGKREYEEGLRERDLIKVRKGCEEIFHSLVELSDGILKENGYSIPEDHMTRAELLRNFGMHKLYAWTKEYLHDACYYSGIVKEKLLKEAIEAINTEIRKRI